MLKLKFLNVKKDSLIMVVRMASQNSNVQKIMTVEKVIMILLQLAIVDSVNMNKEVKEKIAKKKF